MAATGGTIVAAIEELKNHGVDHRLMRVVSKYLLCVCAFAASIRISWTIAGCTDRFLNDLNRSSKCFKLVFRKSLSLQAYIV